MFEDLFGSQVFPDADPAPVLLKCPVPACPLGAAVLVHQAEISGIQRDLAAVKRGLDRIQWATITALGALVLACLVIIFRLLGGKVGT
jgi:hypothetical protein